MTRPREQSRDIQLRHNWQQQVTPRPRTQVPLVVDARIVERPRQRRPQGVVPPPWYRTRRGWVVAGVVASVSVLAVAAAGWWVATHVDVVAQVLVGVAVLLFVVPAAVPAVRKHCPGCRG